METVYGAVHQAPALKEWAVAVQALAAGETILLLRKGGIREQRFLLPSALERPQFWLYPTYEHQKPHWLKPDYAAQVQPVESGWHPETIAVQAWAELTDWREIDSDLAVASLLPHHIWNAAFVTERLKWKPKLPLTALLLRCYRLAQPQIIPYHQTYGGCKSWIDLALAGQFDSSHATPALTDAAYAAQQSLLIWQLNHAKPIAPTPELRFS